MEGFISSVLYRHLNTIWSIQVSEMLTSVELIGFFLERKFVRKDEIPPSHIGHDLQFQTVTNQMEVMEVF